MIRVTTNGMLRNYKSSLMNSTNHLNDAFKTVLTGRKFNSYAENPAAATQAFRLRTSLSSTAKQMLSCSDSRPVSGIPESKDKNE